MDYLRRINDDDHEQYCTGDCAECEVYAWCTSSAPIEVHTDAPGELEDW